jgi:hypothetical protein
MAGALAVGSLTAAPVYATTPAAHTTRTVSAPASSSWSGIRLPNGYFRSKCLDADSNQWYSDGGRVQIWDCNNNSNQQWWSTWDSYNTTIQTPGAPTGPAKCLDAWPVAGAPGGYRVSVWSCNGGDQQRWDTSGIWPLRNLKWNKCLDLNTTANYNGAPVTLRDCNGAAGQAWG